MNNSVQSINAFFKPRGVAILGASTDTGKLGYAIARNLVNIGYPGVIHFINPHGGELFGRPIYTDLDHVPDPVDMAVMLIPAPATPQALRACGKRGIHAVIISSGGFRETGTEGAHLEQELLEIASQYDIRIIGPNCIGVIDTHHPLDTTFLKPPTPPTGDLAFISHSGATCAAVVDWARGQGFGFSRLVSLGNQIDVNETDMLLAVASDPHSHSLALYLESISDGHRFVEHASQVTRKKPVVALKAGRYSSGQRAAASHTGALAGQDLAIDAAFRRAGVIRADNVEELFEWARTLANCPLPRGRSIAVLTDAGGMGVIASDALEANGLYLAELSDDTVQELKTILPPAAGINNPVDMLASATPEQYATCLRLLLEDEQVDGVLVIILPPPIYSGRITSEAIIPVIKATDKPVLTALVGELLIHEALEVFHREAIPEFRFPERAAAALGVLAKRAEYLSTAMIREEPVISVDQDAVQGYLQDLSSRTMEKILTAYGIPTLTTYLVKTKSEAIEIAQRLGFPIVLKVASPDLLHKSDYGGVLTNLIDKKAVLEGYDLLMSRVQSTYPSAKIEGIIVQKMAPNGQEVITGIVQDAIFGALIMFGSGGIEVEGLKDVSFALAPLSRKEAEAMLDSTWAGRKLAGYRNIEPGDREAVVDALIRLSRLAADYPEIKEMEINPLRVLPIGQGVLALDVRVISG